MRWILAVDQSTSGTKALLVGEDGATVHADALPQAQRYPRQGWVEQDMAQVWRDVLALLRGLPDKAGVPWPDVVGLAVTNQRETTVAFRRDTGEPIAPALSWQDLRGEDACAALASANADARALVRERTGLDLSAYYSAAKAAWLLENAPDARTLAAIGGLCVSTVDAYLVHRLTGGAVFATDASNASRTQLLDLDRAAWDPQLLRLFGIPAACLPEVRMSDAGFGVTAEGLLPMRLPIAAVLGDSHAALFGQGCLEPGMAKATYGTGSSIMLQTGRTHPAPPPGLAASIAWGRGAEVRYVLEGNVTCSGDTLNWLIDGLGLFASPREIDDAAAQCASTEGVFLVPAFSGLGAPYFDPAARAALLGLSRGSGRPQVARAALESIAFQNAAVLEAMGTVGRKPTELRVDGGPTRSDLLMQVQADLAGLPVRRAARREVSALGVAYLGGLALGVWNDLADVLARRGEETVFVPRLAPKESRARREQWHRNVARVRTARQE